MSIALVRILIFFVPWGQVIANSVQKLQDTVIVRYLLIFLILNCRDIKADQYGVRFAVIVENVPIKFEIVAEGRIQFGSPALYEWCPLPCLNFEDSCSEKLLANADRWNDVSVESRDLIDLAVLRLQSVIPQSAYDKAETAYPVIEPLAKAIGRFQRDTKYRDRCFSALQVNDRIKSSYL